MNSYKAMCDELEQKIQDAYEQGASVEVAERLAAEFLYAQLALSKHLTKLDLESRMRKSGVKGVRAALYVKAASGGEKKPTEAALAAMLDSDEIVAVQQQMLDDSESSYAELKRVYDVYTNAHIYFRGIAKGSFGG